MNDIFVQKKLFSLDFYTKKRNLKFVDISILPKTKHTMALLCVVLFFYSVILYGVVANSDCLVSCQEEAQVADVVFGFYIADLPLLLY